MEWEQIVQNAGMPRSHLVILGAGASIASCPNGDKNNLVLPNMNNFISVLNLEKDFQKFGFNCKNKNIESIYSEIYGQTKFKRIQLTIEEKVRDYFTELELPDNPTIYDYLVLSLRPKDAIATFNWDPFLWQACARNHQFTKPPNVYFLHGCVMIGYCWEHKSQGFISGRCSHCGKLFEPTKILYPVTQKDYTSDPYISSQWKTFKNALDNAFVVTIFGYGAPDTDAAAIEIMREAWGDYEEREYEEIEIIDIQDEDALSERWNKFIHSHHYRVKDNYFDSILSYFLRRSIEAMWMQIMEGQFLEYKPIPKFERLEEFWEWLEPIKSFEKQV